ncbi:hypothetical protein CONPUDRAFT_107252 [Coniophora puteana RWD-64-598 SS2]|uniref:Formin binding protein n=1 Tax=Coniophora puteana (strain RWD-64-598) TaxID=741705 RepID=A0A5M3MIV7_CONPW|nr:uncharacterized protein CONPUDRAFT_107252 [Coniophora puteana RWD-64-598 SS2]EIW79152.1 hypothetical protein CONPUDRAFT_107252 [Coniophora puteana RWD-64-598 SS2]
MWTEHRNPEGRTYWFNTSTRESVWEKPDDLKTPFERALGETKWKEYFSGGRKYYYNTESKESKWDMPDELLLLLEKVEKESSPAPAPTATPSAPLAITSGQATPAVIDNSKALVLPGQVNGTDALANQAPSGALPARPNLPEDPVIPHNGFATFEEGEKAFIHLLRKAGVSADWSWDQTMRTIITDPLYKALNSLAEKKATWQKYTEGLKQKEQEERDSRLSKLRPAIRNMLRGNPNVFHYSTFATADKLFSQHPIWQQAKIETERKLIFEEYVDELKQREVQESRAARSRSVAKVVQLFKTLEVDVLTRWRKAHDLLVNSDEWLTDLELQKLPTLDILLAFEDYSRVKEREFDEEMRRTQLDKTRRERKAREGFKALLQELIESGKIKARTKWKQVYPSFASDERYLNLLGKPGSNPLELFWDVVDGLDQRLDEKIATAEKAIQAYNDERAGKDGVEIFKLAASTELSAFQAIVTHDAEIAKDISSTDIEEVFTTLHDQAVKKQSDERRRQERKQRHLQDDLRYALRKLPEPLNLDATYEEAVPLIEHLPEYKALEDEEGRRAAFAKYVKRQKERIREAASEDGGSTTSRKRKEPTRDDRDRDRDYRDRTREYDRDGRGSRRHRGDDYDGYSRDSRDRDHKDSRSGKDREYRSRHARDDRDDYHRSRRSPRSDHGRGSRHDDAPPYDDERDRSRDRQEKRHESPRPSKREASRHEEPARSEKRPRYDPDVEDRKEKGREETPEEGEI